MAQVPLDAYCSSKVVYESQLADFIYALADRKTLDARDTATVKEVLEKIKRDYF